MVKRFLAISLIGAALLLSSCSNLKTSTASKEETKSAAESSEKKDTATENAQTKVPESETKAQMVIPEANFSDSEIESAKSAVTEYLKGKDGTVEGLSFDKEVDKMQKSGFLQYGMGKDSGLTADNVIILVGKGTYKNKTEKKEAHVFYLGRKDKETAWEVKDMSY